MVCTLAEIIEDELGRTLCERCEKRLAVEGDDDDDDIALCAECVERVAKLEKENTT